MMIEDFSESGHEVREKRTQMYPDQWYSLTLQDIVRNVANQKLSRWDNLYWLDRLENFFMSV